MIKRDLAEILQREMRDPRLALVSVTDVDVARDFTVAKVFISVIGCIPCPFYCPEVRAPPDNRRRPLHFWLPQRNRGRSHSDRIKRVGGLRR